MIIYTILQSQTCDTLNLRVSRSLTGCPLSTAPSSVPVRTRCEAYPSLVTLRSPVDVTFRIVGLLTDLSSGRGAVESRV